MDVISIINAHFTASDIAIFYIVFSTLVQVLPQPHPEKDGKAYVVFYRFAHALMANWKPASKNFEAPKTVTKGEITSEGKITLETEEDSEKDKD